MTDIIQFWQNTETIWLILLLFIWYVSGAGMFILSIYQINKSLTYGELVTGLVVGGLSGIISFLICGFIVLIKFFEQNEGWWNRKIKCNNSRQTNV